ncbi:endolytic transglycosylase MltG [Christensenella intestinihominis]|uniref:endolytic transglycosylase MltG n=1 Tax=Christensenella intestinihominis TaxID=1851429 RepID=UPI000835AA40|nr:endolytic transglycosylase MltG [Christensenella intestinihominis]
MAKKLENPYADRDMGLDRPEILSNGKKPKKKPSTKSTWNKLRPLLTFVISLAVVALIVFGVFNYVREHYFDPVDANDSTAVEVEIPKNSSLSTIAEILYENNLIRNKQVFKLYVDFSDMSSKLKAGTYELSPDMSFDDIVYTLQEGNVVEEIDIQFIEGRTAKEYGRKLVDNYGILKNTDYYMQLVKTGGNFVNEYPFLAEAKAKDDARPADQRRYYLLEGYLAPDTYRYLTNATAEDVIKKQLDQFVKILSMKKKGEEQTYEERAAEIGMSIDDMVTLASIIEREASKSEDFPKVSAVFHNRLASEEEFAHFLDSDATQAYGLGITGRVILEPGELTTPTPYNTRRNGVGFAGLPAGPIGNPGRLAIEAALYPDEDLMQEGDEYYYFLATDIENGVVEFVHTNEELEALADQWRDEWARIDAQASANSAGEQ